VSVRMKMYANLSTHNATVARETVIPDQLRNSYYSSYLVPVLARISVNRFNCTDVSNSMAHRLIRIKLQKAHMHFSDKRQEGITHHVPKS
jgi:hypothetical protein